MRNYFEYKRDWQRERRRSRIFAAAMIVLTLAVLATAIAGAVIDNAKAHRDEGNGIKPCITTCNVEYPTEYRYVVIYTEAINDGKTAVSVPCTDEELEELARLVYLEAGAQSATCQRLIAEVAFNQLNYGAWGSTLHDVIYAAGNYEPAAAIPYTETTDEIRAIVRDVYENGIDIPARIMFFRAWYYHAWQGAVPEFECEGVYFSSSYWCK